MKTKYRIVKHASIDRALDPSDKPYVYYIIQERCVFIWNDLLELKGSKYGTFKTVDEAVEALKKHVEITNELESDGNVMKTLEF